jgi:hypothetical protein
MPVAAKGAQRRLQQPLQASHSVPSTPPLQYVAPDGGGPHLPTVAPAAMSQMPPQQSIELEHTSPVWMHQPGVRAHVPLLQKPEQQSPLAPHGLPAVLQNVLIGWQAPFVQVPLQHAPFALHGWLSATQLVAQTPLLQLSEQQSVPVAHAPPCETHLPTDEPHVPVAASHVPEQHCVALWHAVPVAPQPGPTLASPPAEPGSMVLVEPPQLTTSSTIK